MLQTDGDRGRRRARSIVRSAAGALRRLPALYVATAAFVVFLACGRWGIVRRASWRRRAATIAIASSFAWILASAWHDGRTTLNLFAIAAAQLAGVALYLGRRTALAAARGRLR